MTHEARPNEDWFISGIKVAARDTSIGRRISFTHRRATSIMSIGEATELLTQLTGALARSLDPSPIEEVYVPRTSEPEIPRILPGYRTTRTATPPATLDDVL